MNRVLIVILILFSSCMGGKEQSGNKSETLKAEPYINVSSGQDLNRVVVNVSGFFYYYDSIFNLNSVKLDFDSEPVYTERRTIFENVRIK